MDSISKEKIIKIIFESKVFHYDEERNIKTEHIGNENHYINFNNFYNAKSENLKIVCNIMAKDVNNKKWEFNKIGGVPYVSIPAAYLFSIALKKSYFTIGTEIESDDITSPDSINYGLVDKKDNILIFDEVCASGDSIVDKVIELRRHGLNPKYAYVLYDKNLGATNRFKKLGIEYSYGINLDEFLDIAMKYKFINQKISGDIRHLNRMNRELQMGKIQEKNNLLKSISQNHIPIFLFDKFVRGDIKRKELSKYDKHLKSCDYCNAILNKYERESRYEFIPS